MSWLGWTTRLRASALATRGQRRRDRVPDRHDREDRRHARQVVGRGRIWRSASGRDLVSVRRARESIPSTRELLLQGAHVIPVVWPPLAVMTWPWTKFDHGEQRKKMPAAAEVSVVPAASFGPPGEPSALSYKGQGTSAAMCGAPPLHFRRSRARDLLHRSQKPRKTLLLPAEGAVHIGGAPKDRGRTKIAGRVSSRSLTADSVRARAAFELGLDGAIDVGMDVIGAE